MELCLERQGPCTWERATMRNIWEVVVHSSTCNCTLNVFLIFFSSFLVTFLTCVIWRLREKHQLFDIHHCWRRQRRRPHLYTQLVFTVVNRVYINTRSDEAWGRQVLNVKMYFLDRDVLPSHDVRSSACFYRCTTIDWPFQFIVQPAPCMPGTACVVCREGFVNTLPVLPSRREVHWKTVKVCLSAVHSWIKWMKSWVIVFSCPRTKVVVLALVLTIRSVMHQTEQHSSATKQKLARKKKI